MVFLCKDGRMVTSIPNKFTRDLLRRQSTALMVTKLTRRKFAKLKGLIYPHTLDIRAFTLCPIPVHLQHLLLAEDQANSVDLSGCMFRMHRAVGGSWTEYLKTDKELFHLAEAHATAVSFPSIRTCPFCCLRQGTPRHFVMECCETKEYAEDICDAVEVELSSLGCTQVLIDAATKTFLGRYYPSVIPPFRPMCLEVAYPFRLALARSNPSKGCCTHCIAGPRLRHIRARKPHGLSLSLCFAFSDRLRHPQD